MEAENQHQSAAGTTSALDYTNGLPPELLLMVFDYFDSGTRRTVSEVCQRWSEIISRYLATDEESKTVYLTPELLRSTSKETMKEYRSVDITHYDYKTFRQIKMLEYYLAYKELVENVVELTVGKELYHFEKEIYLPNLRTLRVEFATTMIWDSDDYDYDSVDDEDEKPKLLQCGIIAPKLRTFHQKYGVIPELLLMFSEQIETLIVHYRSTDMVSTIGNLYFSKIRNLTLSSSGIIAEGTDFKALKHSAPLRALFGRLDCLKLKVKDCWYDYDLVIIIIEEARNLKSLEIDQDNIDQNTLLQISKLKRLEELTLTGHVPDCLDTVEWSHSNLTKLKTNLDLPLDNFPNLRLLELEDVIRSDFTSFLRPVADQIQSLCLRYATLDRNTIDGISSLVNLCTLRVEHVNAESAKLEELLSRLRKIKNFRFETCHLAIAACPENCDCYLCDDDFDSDEVLSDVPSVRYYFREEKKAQKRRRTFLERLPLRYVDCAIVVGDEYRSFD